VPGEHCKVVKERFSLHHCDSDGASDYGNKIGEPIIQGFCRANQLAPLNSTDNGAEWVKPIMFSGGIGHVYDQHIHKLKPEVGWKIVRVGGATYRLGIGGGAASSVSQTDQSINRLLSAVQRGDAQTENRMDAWLRACVNMLDANPILSVHSKRSFLCSDLIFVIRFTIKELVAWRM